MLIWREPPNPNRQLLSPEKKLSHPIKGKISYSGYFSYKIEKEWTDLFWAFRYGKKTTDDCFSNYFEFVTQMLYFKKYKNAKVEDFKNSFVQYEDVFNEEENLLFLYDSLDKLYECSCENGTPQPKNLIELFNSVIKNCRLFWNSDSDYSLFERVILNNRNDDVRNKIILFFILKYMIKYKLSSIDDALIRNIIAIRNLLQATRQRNETKYNTNIRINNFGSYWFLFKQLLSSNIYKVLQEPSLNNKGSQISDASLKNEIEKVKILQANNQAVNAALLWLEEYPHFGGLIHLLKPSVNYLKYPLYLKAVKEIWDETISDTLRIQALIASGFDGLKIRETKMGKTYYFGRQGNLDIVLTSEEEVVSISVLSLLDAYLNSKAIGTIKKLEEIKTNWFIANVNDRTYKYYFLKYSEFSSKLNYYVWPNDYEISMLGTESSNPLVAYHISPFVLTVCKRISDKNVCDEELCYIQYTGSSPLFLKNGVTLISKEEGWLINKHPLITPAIVSKYSLQTINDIYILKDNDNKDRIEIAIDFINDIS